MRSRRWAVALIVPLLLASGCGEEESPAAQGGSTESTESPTESPTESAGDTPSPSPSETLANLDPCGTVWKDGSKLPRDYEGCLEADTAVTPDQQGCSFGKALVRYDDHFYAVRGGTIHETSKPLDKDRGFQSAMKSCTA